MFKPCGNCRVTGNKRLAEVLSLLLRRLGLLFAEFLIRQHEIDVAKA